MDALLSRTDIARHFDSHTQVRSTTHLRAGKVFSPHWSSFSSPIRRICGLYW